MTRISPRQPLIVFAVTASLGPIALGLASLWILNQTPAVPQPTAAPAPASEAATGPEPRRYLPLSLPVTVSLPEGGGTLSIGLGVALREAGSLELMARLADRQQEAQAELADVMLRAAENLPADTRLAVLRSSLPETLKEAMNARLIAMGEEPAILEVLILDWAHAP
jgi:hypothetical protein